MPAVQGVDPNEIAANDHFAIALHGDALNGASRYSPGDKGIVQRPIALQARNAAPRRIVEGAEVARNHQPAVRLLHDVVDISVGAEAREKARICSAVVSQAPNAAHRKSEGATNQHPSLARWNNRVDRGVDPVGERQRRVKLAIGKQLRRPVAIGPVDLGKGAANGDFAATLHRDCGHQRVSALSWIKGKIDRPVGGQSRYMIARYAIGLSE